MILKKKKRQLTPRKLGVNSQPRKAKRKSPYTMEKKEYRLNTELSDTGEAVLLERYFYLTDKSRKEWCSLIILTNHIRQSKLGTLLRRIERDEFNALTCMYM